MSEIGDEPGSAAANQELSLDERAELERFRAEAAEAAALRAEVTELRRQRAGAGRRRIGWRTPIAVVLIILGCVLAPVSLVGIGLSNQLSSTSRYVANVAPLVHEPAIQNALTDKLTTEITGRINVTAYTNQAATLLTNRGLTRVGTLLKSFGPSITSAVDGYIHTQVHRLVTGPRFARTWIQVNTVAHQELVKALSGQGHSAIKVSNGEVVIDLAPFIAIVKQDLSARGFTLVNKIPAVHPTFALFSARYLVKAQGAYRLINDLKFALPIVTLLLIGLGVYIAPGHRRALVGAGLGFAASMLVLGLGLTLFRSIYLNSVPPAVLPSDAAAVLFDTLVRYLRDALRTLLVAGLVIAAGAFFTGPSVTAVQTRRGLSSGLGWIRSSGERLGVSTGPVGVWTYLHRKGLRVGAVALAALIFVFTGRPTSLDVILIAVLLLAVLGLIELLGRPVAEAAGHT